MQQRLRTCLSLCKAIRVSETEQAPGGGGDGIEGIHESKTSVVGLSNYGRIQGNEGRFSVL